MMKWHNGNDVCINWRFLLFLTLLLFIIYGNTFNSSWHFDDYHNIVEAEALHINSLNPASVRQVISDTTGKIKIFYRPIARLSFAVNWYLHQSDVTGYHLVNLWVHILTAFILYVTILNLFKTPNLSGQYTGDEQFVAILATLLWAANPIQTQAVTYIVQRMASMAAMFYILGVYLYIKARLCTFSTNRILFFGSAFFAFLLAIGSKENSLLFPMALLLLEIVFFQDFSDNKIKKRFVLLSGFFLVMIFLCGVFLFMDGEFLSRLQTAYQNRTYTISERLMTQSRVIVFYLSQIFYPIADRLSVVHDIEISQSLFHPLRTLFSICFLLILFAAAFLMIKKIPLFSFAVLFFLLNHLIESTIIPLELIFEHRNYLPSLFLFLPIAAGMIKLINYYSVKKKSAVISAVLICFSTCLIIIFGAGTFLRNMVWQNEKTLWEDAIQKAPHSGRPYQNLAACYYTIIKDYDNVLALCEKAANLTGDTVNRERFVSLKNIANVYIEQQRDIGKAVRIYQEILEFVPDNNDIRYSLSLAYLKIGEVDRAMEQCRILLSNEPNSVKYLSTMAFILIKKQDYTAALPYLIDAVHFDPDDDRVMLSLGVVKMYAGKHSSAERYFKKVMKSSSLRLSALFLNIENSVRKEDVTRAMIYADELISNIGLSVVQNKLSEFNGPNLTWPVSTDKVTPIIVSTLMEHSNNIYSLGYPEKADSEL